MKRLLVLCVGRNNAPQEVALIRNAFNFTDDETLFVDYFAGNRPDEVHDMGQAQAVAALVAKYKAFDAVLLVNCGVYLARDNDPFQHTIKYLISVLVRPDGFLMVYPTVSEGPGVTRLRNAFYQKFTTKASGAVYRLALQDPDGFVYKGRLGLQGAQGPFDLDLYQRADVPPGPKAPLTLRRT